MIANMLVPIVALACAQGFILSLGAQTPALPKVFDPTCKDAIDSCWNMPEANCRAPYEAWAQQNCANRCGYCIGPTTPAPPCVDKLPNCDTYQKSVCSNPDYTSWVGENCRYYCRMCPQSELNRLDSITTTIRPEDCVDKVDCRQYGADACSDTFKGWSNDNCPNYCGFCTGIPTPPPTCEDKIPNCKAYNPDTCTNPDFQLWVQDNCKKFCGLCAGSSGPATMAPPVPGHNLPVITYQPPSPPSPGKRGEPKKSKREFEASHHHGGTPSCWDSGSTDPSCLTAQPTVDGATNAVMINGSDFPGSEYRPHPTPDPKWDNKPSVTTVKTKAPTTTTTEATTVSTTQSTTELPPTGTVYIVTEGTTQGSTEAITTTTALPITVTEASTQPPVVDTPTTTNLPPAGTSPRTTTTQLPPTFTNMPVTFGATTTQTDTSQVPAQPTPSSTMGAPASPQTNTMTLPTEEPTPPSPPPLTSSSTMGAPEPPHTTQAPTQTTQAPVTTPDVDATTVSCADTIDNCAVYGAHICTDKLYKPWATAHCSAFCGFCTVVTLTPFQCGNKISTCAEYDGGNLCSATNYFAWARENCFAYCGFPPCGTRQEQTTTYHGNGTDNTETKPPNSVSEITATEMFSTTEVTTVAGNDTCVDKSNDCFSLSDEKCFGIYEAWARSHCGLRCGFCGVLPCEDKTDCAAYPDEICTSDTYALWSRENCRKYCNWCGRPTPPPSTTQQPATSVAVSGSTPLPSTTQQPATSVAVSDTTEHGNKPSQNPGRGH